MEATLSTGRKIFWEWKLHKLRLTYGREVPGPASLEEKIEAVNIINKEKADGA